MTKHADMIDRMQKQIMQADKKKNNNIEIGKSGIFNWKIYFSWAALTHIDKYFFKPFE